MNLKSASINDFQGEGKAEIVDLGNKKQVKGTFISESPSVGAQLMIAQNQSHSTLFTGVLYDGVKETNLSFPVHITNVKDNIITFKGSGNPYLA